MIVAHRLRTIIDFDKVLVLDQGEVIEYDSPHALLQKKDSLFSDMIGQSGEEAALRELAEASDKKTEL